VLDVGCGSGYLTAAMARMVEPKGRVVGIDIVKPLVSLAKNNIEKADDDLLTKGASWKPGGCFFFGGTCPKGLGGKFSVSCLIGLSLYYASHGDHLPHCTPVPCHAFKSSLVHLLLFLLGVVTLECKTGWEGDKEKGPYDAIHVGAAASSVPRSLVEQLKVCFSFH